MDVILEKWQSYRDGDLRLGGAGVNSKGGPVDLMGCGGQWGASSERTQDSSTKTRVLTYIMS